MRQGEISVDGPSGAKNRRIAFTDWGAEDNTRIAICVHGLTRVGRDFDALAEALSDDYRVICPDVAGRGKSDWLLSPEDYSYAQYMTDTHALMAAIGATEIDWVGTSMGGFLGMMLAASKNSPIKRLVLNDIGPFLPQSALARIGEYLAKGETFVDVYSMEAHLRLIHAPFGPLTNAQWHHMAEHSVRPADGQGSKLAFHYDPTIAEAFSAVTGADIDVWEMWDKITCPVLTLRGEGSDVLPKETAEEMTTRGPKSKLVEFPNTGHASVLMAIEQTALVRDWLISDAG